LKTVAEIVNYLTRHYQEKEDILNENLLPEPVDDLVGQMGRFLKTRLEEDTPHKVVWDEFLNQPEEKSASLTGILEALFEAQPGVRERVDGFMREITAIEAENSDHTELQGGLESNLNAEPGGFIPDDSKDAAILADNEAEKNPSIYLYGNERADFESTPEAPVSKPFMIGKNAQIVFNPEAKAQFPEIFDHLFKTIETSKSLNSQDKHDLQENLQEIHSQLTGEKSYIEQDLAQSIQGMWEVEPSYANALIKSLQNDVSALPIEAQKFIIQLHTPLNTE
jgi:hypothetical protein